MVRNIKQVPRNLPNEVRTELRATETADLSAGSVLEALPFGIGIIDHSDDGQLLLSQANAYLLEILGLEPSISLPLHLDEISDLAFDSAFLGSVARCLDNREQTAFSCHLPLSDAARVFAGRVQRVDLPATDRSRILLTLIDRTSEQARQEHLVYDALHDPLTGLPNYGYFTLKIGEVVEEAETADGIAVFMLNIDRFQIINESLGYSTGDTLLNEIANRLEAIRPESGILARFNSDEFALFANNVTTETDAHALARKFHEGLSAPFTIDDQDIHLTAAIGVALHSSQIHNGEDLVRNASIAMHRAKSEGRGRSVIYHHDLRNRARSLFTLEADLRQAIEQKALELHYQPICNLRTGELVGFEALARWNHPERGSISPIEFISVAENCGLILPLGRWALEEACRQLTVWDQISGRTAALTMNVNVSGIQLAEPDFVDTVRAALSSAGQAGDRIRLEITESTIMTNAELIADLLLDLKALGLCLAVDDFGTGYSSLSYLNRFPIDTLKIDRTFVNKLTENADDAKIVHIMTMLAQNLGMTVVAEGVETEAQLESLRQLGCHFGQGYFFAKPLSPSDATALLDKGGPLPHSPEL